MKRSIVILLFIPAFLFSVNSVWSDSNILGAGIILGEPTGICAKLWLGDTMAVDAAFAWSLFKNTAFLIHADYLFHLMNPFEIPKGDIAIYVGVGGRVNFGNVFKLGVRIPLGITYIFEKVPLDIFLEINPILDLIPTTSFDGGGSIGVRFYFIKTD